jgi:WD40 repeat protein
MAIQIPPADAGPSKYPYRLAHTLAGHTRSVTALRFSNDGKLLVSAGMSVCVDLLSRAFGQIRVLPIVHRTI